MIRLLTLRRISLLALLAAAAVVVPAASSSGDLAGSIATGQGRVSQLKSAIHSETSTIQGFQGTVSTLQTRLSAIEDSVAVQEDLLASVRSQLTAARSRLVALRARYAHDRQVLAAELLADYESPPPSVVNVIVDAHGFNDLLTGLSDLKAIERQNSSATKQVNSARLAVAAEAIRLAQVEVRRQRATAAVLVERDEVAQLRLSIVNRELVVERARAEKTGELTSLQKTLSHEASVLQQQAAAAAAASGASGGAAADQSNSSGGAAAPSGGCINTPFVAHGGEFGFFQAPGTNYSVNEEPVIAARLDALGKALQLHLEGISGYRTPEHSVEVGGFADDPHTRGEASDTPGVEGVAESTLEQYCLTRPFPGPAEADHIQELGSPL
jgi:septal ring factor EnvC (AmiA/AmiB activator)